MYIYGFISNILHPFMILNYNILNIYIYIYIFLGRSTYDIPNLRSNFLQSNFLQSKDEFPLNASRVVSSFATRN